MEAEAPEERRTAVGVVGDADAEALAAGGFRTVRFGRAEEAVAAAARGDVARVLLDAADVRRTLGASAPAAVPDRVLLRLTRQQRELVGVLAGRGGEPVPREEIERVLFGKEKLVETRSVDTAVYRIRRRLGRFGDCLVTTPTRGFAWDARAGAAARRRARRKAAAGAATAVLLAAAACTWFFARPPSGGGGAEATSLCGGPGAPPPREYRFRLDFLPPATNTVLFSGSEGLELGFAHGEALDRETGWRPAGAYDPTNRWFKVRLDERNRTFRLYVPSPGPERPKSGDVPCGAPAPPFPQNPRR